MSIATPQPEWIAQAKIFLGQIEPKQLCYVDSFIAQKVAVFMPAAVTCPASATPMHTHPAHMFMMNFADTTSIVLKNSRHLGQPNTVLYLPPDLLHQEVNESGVPRYVTILIDPLFLQQHAIDYKYFNPDLNSLNIFPASDVLLSATKRFIGECKVRKAGSDKLLDALSVEIVHILLRNMLGIKPDKCRQAYRIEINRCIEYMRQNLSEKLTLQSLATYSGMSVSHFTRIFRNETGLSPIEYLIDMRLEVASRLLLCGKLSIKQISVECGFSSPSHFSSSFQKKYNTSPSDHLLHSSSK